MVDVLIRCPDTSKRQEKKEDMSLLFVHMHHLINEFRPHQARETLRVLLEVQRRQRLDTAQRFHKHLDKVREALQSTLSSLPDRDLESQLRLPSQGQGLLSPERATGILPEECLSQDKMMCDIVDAL